eukprot:368486-Amphidinium_carterae.1
MSQTLGSVSGSRCLASGSRSLKLIFAVVRALEECSPHRVVSGCKGVVVALRVVQLAHRRPKRRHRDVEERARVASMPQTQLHW